MLWKFASLGSVIVALVLSGCSSMSEPKAPVVSVAEAGSGRCNAAAAEFAIGQQASAELLEQARVKSGAQNARVLKPSDMVTLEYRSDRLNLNADDRSIITRVNCG
jgi:PBP1b-binding outer membrane lipoprotein LpoB